MLPNFYIPGMNTAYTDCKSFNVLENAFSCHRGFYGMTPDEAYWTVLPQDRLAA